MTKFVMKNPYKSTEIFRCVHESHQGYKNKISVYHILKARSCYPEGCIYFRWRCKLLNKKKKCHRGYRHVGRNCFGCKEFYDEKIHNFPELQVSQDEYKDFLKKYTRTKSHVTITDFRSLNETPDGNRFLAYSLFPQSVVNVKIRYDDKERQRIALSIGHSIFNKNCNVNVGLLLSRFEGGGHQSAASCRFHASKADDYIPKIIEVLLKNEPNED